MGTGTVVVTPAAPAHVDEAVELLAGAFRDDGVMSAFVGGAGDRRGRLRHVFRVLVRTGLRAGAVDLARSAEDGSVLGVAVWRSPAGDSPGLRERLGDALSLLQAVGPGGLRRVVGLVGALRDARPGEAHWYLASIGVHASGRGLGVGSALLAARLHAIDGCGGTAPAYLEASSERSAALYERFGFVPIGTVAGFPGPVRPIAMWRSGPPTQAPVRAREEPA